MKSLSEQDKGLSLIIRYKISFFSRILYQTSHQLFVRPQVVVIALFKFVSAGFYYLLIDCTIIKTLSFVHEAQAASGTEITDKKTWVGTARLTRLVPPRFDRNRRRSNGHQFCLARSRNRLAQSQAG